VDELKRGRGAVLGKGGPVYVTCKQVLCEGKVYGYAAVPCAAGEQTMPLTCPINATGRTHHASQNAITTS